MHGNLSTLVSSSDPQNLSIHTKSGYNFMTSLHNTVPAVDSNFSASHELRRVTGQEYDGALG